MDQLPAQVLDQLLDRLTNIDAISHRFLHNQEVAVALANYQPDFYSFVHGEYYVHMYLPNAATDYVQGSIVRSNSFFEQSLLATMGTRYIRRGMKIVDIGANIGNHSVYFAKVCGASEVHSFEPNPEMYAILSRNIALNYCDNVITYKLGIAAAASRAQMSPKDARNFGGMKIESHSAGSIELVSLDQLQLKPDFIKIDVEGMAASVLKGALETINRCSPCIMMELWETERSECQEILNGLQYAVDFQDGADYVFIRR